MGCFGWIPPDLFGAFMLNVLFCLLVDLLEMSLDFVPLKLPDRSVFTAASCSIMLLGLPRSQAIFQDQKAQSRLEDQSP